MRPICGVEGSNRGSTCRAALIAGFASTIVEANNKPWPGAPQQLLRRSKSPSIRRRPIACFIPCSLSNAALMAGERIQHRSSFPEETLD